MFTGSIQFRSFHAGCAHEIILPNGKVILIDPFLRDSISDGHDLTEITGADYILVTHTHFDHDLDLGYFVKKFHSLVFVGAFSAQALIQYHGISYDHVIPVLPGQSYTLDDFKLEIMAAKHNPTGGRVYDPQLDFAKKDVGVEGHKACDDCGNIESVDYLVTTSCNFRFMTASGQTIWKEPFETARQKAPNLLFRQAGVRNGGADLFGDGQVTARELAELLVRYQAQMIVPFHMDVLYRRWGVEKTEAYFHEVEDLVAQLLPGACFLLPQAWKWYRVGLCVMEEKP